MIITQLNGGLGNQMFEYAVARRLAWKLGRNFKIDKDLLGISDSGSGTTRYYSLGAFNIIEDFATYNDIIEVKSLNRKRGLDIGREKGDLRFNPEVLSYGDNVYFQGYWQCENYFKDIADILRMEFSLKAELSIEAQKILAKIEEAKSTAISLHIRRGDYIKNRKVNDFHGCCSLEYYKACIKKIKQEYPNICLYIFTDDVSWVKETLTFDGEKLVVSDFVKNDIEELFLMSKCDHYIIANSSFSWWGAWLNSNANKIVFAPKKWFKNPDVFTDIIPPYWQCV